MKTLQSDDISNQSPTHVLMEVDSTSSFSKNNNNLNINEDISTTPWQTDLHIPLEKVDCAVALCQEEAADSESINQQKISNLNDEFQLKPIFMSTNTEAM